MPLVPQIQQTRLLWLPIAVELLGHGYVRPSEQVVAPIPTIPVVIPWLPKTDGQPTRHTARRRISSLRSRSPFRLSPGTRRPTPGSSTGNQPGKNRSRRSRQQRLSLGSLKTTHVQTSPSPPVNSKRRHLHHRPQSRGFRRTMLVPTLPRRPANSSRHTFTADHSSMASGG